MASPAALRIIAAHHRTALLTNNFLTGNPDWPSGGSFAPILELFDVVVEFRQVGVRKPEPEFYEIALERLGVEAGEAVFLDDLGVNLKPAWAMGMSTIKVVDPDAALDELSAIIGLSSEPTSRFCSSFHNGDVVKRRTERGVFGDQWKSERERRSSGANAAARIMFCSWLWIAWLPVAGDASSGRLMRRISYASPGLVEPALDRVPGTHVLRLFHGATRSRCSWGSG